MSARKRRTAQTDHGQLPWIGRLRLRVLAWVVGIALATFTTVAWAGLPWVPLVGVAVAAAAVTVTKSTLRLASSTCLTCGRDLSAEPISPYGIACPKCGSVHQPGPLERAARGRSGGLR